MRIYAFSNGTVDNWNSLSANCVNGSRVSCLIKKFFAELEPEIEKCTWFSLRQWQ